MMQATNYFKTKAYGEVEMVRKNRSDSLHQTKLVPPNTRSVHAYIKELPDLKWVTQYEIDTYLGYSHRSDGEKKKKRKRKKNRRRKKI